MVWYEFNIVNQSINELISQVGIELLGQLKMGLKFAIFPIFTFYFGLESEKFLYPILHYNLRIAMLCSWRPTYSDDDGDLKSMLRSLTLKI